MSTTLTLTSEAQLWGIYHTDREYAQVMGVQFGVEAGSLQQKALQQQGCGHGDFVAGDKHRTVKRLAPVAGM